MEMAKMENNEIKNSKLIPRLRFPGFEGEWVEKILGEIGSTYAGLSGKSKEDFINGNAQYITFLNVLNNVVIDNANHPTVKIKENDSQNDVKCGDLLFNTSSETPEEVGFCAMMKDFKPNIYLNSFCFGYRFNYLKDYQPLFLAYYFRSPYGRRLMTKLAQGVTRYNLSKSNFLKAGIAFPALPEQQKIAFCLSELDNLIAAQGQKVDALKEKKKGLMQQLFPQPGETTPRLRFPGFEGEWVEKKLGEMAEFVNGMAFKPSDWIDKGLKIVRIQNLNDEKAPFNYCNPDIANENCLIDTGDLLFSWSGTPGTSFGAFIWNRGKAVLNQHIFIVYPLKCMKLFLKSVFDASMDIIIEHAHGGAGLRHITKSDLESIKAFFPSFLSEQEIISSCLSSLDDLIDAESAKVEALKDHKKGLMQQLFPQPTK